MTEDAKPQQPPPVKLALSEHMFFYGKAAFGLGLLLSFGVWGIVKLEPSLGHNFALRVVYSVGSLFGFVGIIGLLLAAIVQVVEGRNKRVREERAAKARTADESDGGAES